MPRVFCFSFVDGATLMVEVPAGAALSSNAEAREAREAPQSGGMGPARPRQYRVTVAASQRLEERCFQDLWDAYQHEDLWEPVLECERTASLQGFNFRLLSRGGATVEASIGVLHRRLKFRRRCPAHPSRDADD